MRQLEAHLAVFVEATQMRSSYCSPRWPTGEVAVSVAGSAAQPRGRAGLPQITFRGLRQSFVAILVVARCNVREVSEWAGHNNVAFTLTRYTASSSKTARTG